MRPPRTVLMGALAIIVGAGLMLVSLPDRRDASGDRAAFAAVDERAAQLIAVGDIVTCDGGGETTAALVERMPGIVAALGDVVYDHGTAREFAECYAPRWGRFLARTRPAAGNHEYYTWAAAPYFQYFRSAAGSIEQGWYTYEHGDWLVIVLNSNCEHIPKGCGPGSHQLAWLRGVLGAHANKCTLAYWHAPRFSSGKWGQAKDMAAIWRTLYDAGADVVLSGHDHHYERFAPMDAVGERDEARGVRQFVVGTGGGPIRQVQRRAPNSEHVVDNAHGVLRLELYEDRYSWTFVTADEAVRDTGTASCR